LLVSSSWKDEELASAAAELRENFLRQLLRLLYHSVSTAWVMDNHIPSVRVENPDHFGAEAELFLDTPHDLPVRVVGR
jgi:hypothetical protein